MACSSTQDKYGFEDSRFEKDVDENFHCSICYNVLKEPRMCRNNEHMFCLGCISEHLRVNSQTCPECNEELSVEALRRPRVLNNYLSKLRINCDYAIRGCPEFVCVENLETHVGNCGFAPVLCSNENCGMMVNKQELVYHETMACEYRNVKCHHCEQIQEVVERLEGNLTELSGKVEALEGNVQRNYVEMKRFEENLQQTKKQINEKVETVEGKVQRNYVEMKRFEENLQGTKKHISKTVEAARLESRIEIKEVKKEVEQVKMKVNKDLDEVKVMVTQILEKINTFEHHNKLSFSGEGVLNCPPGDILIAGGDGHSSKTSQSAEMFSWKRNYWFEVPAMNARHIKASSFIYNNQFFVVGGSYCEVIERLDPKELPLKWVNVEEELPCKCDGHQSVVSNERILHIGGDIYRKGRSSAISELHLDSPRIMEELGQMAMSRYCHGAEVG